jgi:hypothetical protein
MYRSDFATILNGNDLPGDDEYNSDDEWVKGGSRTRWECRVMINYKNFFVVNQDDKDVLSVSLVKGVTIASAKRFVEHDLRTVRLRMHQRDCDCSDIDQAYNLTMKLFN